MSPRKPYLRLVQVDTDTAADDAVAADNPFKAGLAFGLLIILSTLMFSAGAFFVFLSRVLA